MDPNQIYQKLRDRIIWLELAPESMLKISELESEFGVSRTPIKEVLIQLSAEGWIVGRGSQYVVTPLSLERFREITEIRMILEVGANVLAMSRFSPENLAELDKIEGELQQFDKNTTIRQIADADINFHGLLYQATKNKQLAQQLSLLLTQNLRFWLSIPRIVEPEAYYKDVQGMISALREKDESSLRKATIAHIEWAADAIISYF